MTLTRNDSGDVRLDVDGAIAVITLNRPEARNALSDTMREVFRSHLRDISETSSVHAIIVTGQGSAFCAGGDIRGMRDRLDAPPGSVAAAGWRRQRNIHHFISELHELEKVTIAAVNGPAMGLGCDLALCCDFIVASQQAVFSMSYIRRGLIPDGGGLYFLPRRVGLARAKELIYSGRDVGAKEAELIGIADRIVTPEDLLGEARIFAQQFMEVSPTAIALSKSILNRTFELDLNGAFALGTEAQAICYTTDEHRSAVIEFLNRTRPVG